MRRRRIIIIIAVVAFLLFGWNTYQQQRLATDNKDQSNQLDSQQELIDGLADVIDDANDQGADVPTPEEVAETVDDAEVSAVGPQGERGPIGETGAAGPAGAGPTDAQILAAVEDYCRTHNECSGSAPMSDIATAVAMYCATEGCRGFEGAVGAQGNPGVDGEQGSPGRGPTQAEIEAGVGAYFAANPPVAGSPGQQGEPGPQGPQGEPGSPGMNGADGSLGPAGTNGQTPTQMTCAQTDPLTFTYDCTVTGTTTD